MATLPETADFVAGIYQIEQTDPVLGGPPNEATKDGLTNIPALQLAKRTLWLKQQVDFLVASLSSLPLDSLAPKASPVFAGDPRGPTPAQFDSDTSLATTAFVQRALGSAANAVNYTATTVLTAADIGRQIFATGGVATLTLPASGGLPAGACIRILSAASGSITIQPAGADTINWVAGPIALGIGDSVELCRFGAGWQIVGGSVVMRRSQGDFGRVLADTGYQRLPSGLILQWGVVSDVSTTGRAVTFPIAFPTSCNAVTTADAGDNDNRIMVPVPVSATGFALKTSTGSSAAFWLAIGH